jgi:hypothetical protein
MILTVEGEYSKPAGRFCSLHDIPGIHNCLPENARQLATGRPGFHIIIFDIYPDQPSTYVHPIIAPVCAMLGMSEQN